MQAGCSPRQVTHLWMQCLPPTGPRAHKPSSDTPIEHLPVWKLWQNCASSVTRGTREEGSCMRLRQSSGGSMLWRTISALMLSSVHRGLTSSTGIVASGSLDP